MSTFHSRKKLKTALGRRFTEPEECFGRDARTLQELCTAHRLMYGPAAGVLENGVDPIGRESRFSEPLMSAVFSLEALLKRVLLPRRQQSDAPRQRPQTTHSVILTEQEPEFGTRSEKTVRLPSTPLVTRSSISTPI